MNQDQIIILIISVFFVGCGLFVSTKKGARNQMRSQWNEMGLDPPPMTSQAYLISKIAGYVFTIVGIFLAAIAVCLIGK